ncbi:hypothetical protein BP6252_00320 [Coleophoma cylindrospora]|uniref:FAD-binding domain-containing protein n=1 Tax=Coleophoma cylindrospora TaxID=1849047 RepID=A0A3D8SR64_9HELO|nr:hypothetical protein BP6252_00320 [Coleophoma cylindrospora]
MTQPRVAIIGAGPGGLTLASLLQRSNLEYTVFELRPKPNGPAGPSGSLDLHPDSGLLAIEACGLTPEFGRLSIDCSEDLILADKHGRVQHTDEGSGERPEVSRSDLSALLLSSVPEDKIHWEHKLVEVTPVPESGKWNLVFQSGPSQQFDLVIGADGAWSKVRARITDVQPHYSSVNCITLTIPHLSTKYPSLATLVGKGSYQACGDKKAIISQRGSQDSARIYLMLRDESESYLSTEGLTNPDRAALKDRLLTSTFADWSPILKSLVATACDEDIEPTVSSKPLYMLPVGQTWSNVPGLTLLGDAAHLMTPFAGEGVNAAMLDAVELAKCIISGIERSETPSVQKYEKDMFERANEKSEETWRNLGIIFAEDAPKTFVELMKSYGPPPE